MTLKSKNSESLLRDPWSEPWGEVVHDPKSLTLLQVVLPTEDGVEKSYGFTYKSLMGWSREKSKDNDILEIIFGKCVLRVEGELLDFFVEALEEGRLKRIQQGYTFSKLAINKISVSST